MATFRTTITSRYSRIFETVTVGKSGHPKRIAPNSEEIESYKRWLVEFIASAEIYDVYAGRISGRDVVAADVFKRQAIPPYSYRYTTLRKAVALLPRENIVAIFGREFANTFFKSL